MSINFYPKEFGMLTKEELYEILCLRTEVFVVEQNCIYQDIDNRDQKAIHILGYHNKKIVAYARIFKSGDYFKRASIGRVLVIKEFRGFGYGFKIMETAIMAINIHYKEFEIAVSAQEHLEKFYNSLGFIKIKESYLEDGIPHIYMIN